MQIIRISDALPTHFMLLALNTAFSPVSKLVGRREGGIWEGLFKSLRFIAFQIDLDRFERITTNNKGGNGL